MEMNYFINYFYYLILLFFNSYSINNVSLKCDETTKHLHKNQLKINKILILNDGIRFFGLFIPFEYLINVSNYGDVIFLNIFGDLDFGKSQTQLFIGNNRVHISFKVNNKILASTLIKKIKYNNYFYFEKSNTLPKILEYGV